MLTGLRLILCMLETRIMTWTITDHLRHHRAFSGPVVIGAASREICLRAFMNSKCPAQSALRQGKYVFGHLWTANFQLSLRCVKGNIHESSGIYELQISSSVCAASKDICLRAFMNSKCPARSVHPRSLIRFCTVWRYILQYSTIL